LYGLSGCGADSIIYRHGRHWVSGVPPLNDNLFSLSFIAASPPSFAALLSMIFFIFNVA
jgi:hypothetical protein